MLNIIKRKPAVLLAPFANAAVTFTICQDFLFPSCSTWICMQEKKNPPTFSWNNNLYFADLKELNLNKKNQKPEKSPSSF